MPSIDWCKRQKSGIELVEPNTNLAKEYLRKAEDSLRAASVLRDNKDWEVSSLYYTMYFASYAILIKCGIKCEIHSCTIALMENVFGKYFQKDEIKLLKDSMRARIDVQYYTNRNIPSSLFNEMGAKSPSFLAKCKDIVSRISENEIKELRERI